MIELDTLLLIEMLCLRIYDGKGFFSYWIPLGFFFVLEVMNETTSKLWSFILVTVFCINKHLVEVNGNWMM